ncbi:centromere/kinetochore protein zw10 homolog isoform X1 [Melopsittacus undulatus]|uniref:centromere/kinetochore protein zw10 homolog isoform X1 n=1 Tax=Melopsittacus undulatus TaxID=13146 RepID=UPI00146BF37F|nr:centromere/kinetochore protein zw10 homolog isoform X1 [Melopsittacus undulatus]
MAAAEAGSLVAAVLAPSGRLDKQDLGTRLGRLSRRVQELKGEVCAVINSKYSEFLPSVQAAEELRAQVQELCGSIDLLKAGIESEVQRDLNVAVAEFTELKQQLERDTLVLSILKKLQEFDIAMEKYNTAFLEKKYVAAAQHLETARSSLRLLESRKGFELKILKALGTELTVQTQNMLYHLGEEWQKLAVWKLPPSKEGSSLESVVHSELHLHTVSSKEEEIAGTSVASVLQAFAVLGELHTKLKIFGQLLLKHILKPLILYPSLQPCTEEQSDVFILRFKSEEPSLDHSSPMKVFDKIKLIFEVLHKYLLNVPLEQPVEDKKGCGVTLAELLGDMIWEDLSDCLIQNCLVNSIPTNSSKLEQYIEVIKSTEEFEKALKNMQFLKEDTTDLLKYARNVNSHFANKKCQDVIVAARNLMTSEIHNTVKITPDSCVALPKLPNPGAGDHSKMPKASELLHNNMVNLENKTKLSQHTFSLPTCRISSSVEKLMELAYQTLLEATSSTDQCCIQLFYSVRNIFQLFHDVVPTYHKENLQKLPQLAAIHHNNCMYIAHHLLTLGHQFRYRLTNILCDGAATFVDMVPGFRRLGTECFLAQMRVQKGEILERLSSARNFSNMDDEENYRAANKAIRQVLHQLKRLGKVWQDVLPVNVYCKAMGTLLNTALTEIVTRITALEDISAEDANRLYSLCRIMVEEGPQVFTPLPEDDKNKKYQEEVPVYVQKWMTFKELMIILQANLQEIVDQWADGKGPLAAEFSAAEVKSLIRALFQNTERRAAALAKIK